MIYSSFRPFSAKTRLFFRALVGVTCLGIALGASTCTPTSADAGGTDHEPAMSMTATQLWPGTEAWANRTLASLTLEQKVAQLFSIPVYGFFKSYDDPAYQALIDLVENLEVGGLIFFQGNPLTQAWMANDLQARAAIPLLVAQDMEWGVGMRVNHTTSFPRAMAVAATRRTDWAYEMGRIAAEEARALGVHQNYAPVADLNNNPQNPVINVRAFGEEPALVTDMLLAYQKGLQEHGLIATAKHFPGHGDTATDSHADLPLLPYKRARLDSLELRPFKASIEAGVMSVMMAHLALPEIEPDPQVPASLSPHIVQNILRNDLNFEGLVVTDALNMRGVTKNFGTGEIAVRAIAAGVDQLLMSEDPYTAHAALMNAVKSGRLTEAQIDTAARRVLQAKAWVKADAQRSVDLSAPAQHVSTREHRVLNEAIARGSITLLRNENDVLPLNPSARILSLSLSDSDEPDAGSYFNRQVREHVTNGSFTARLLGKNAHPDDYASALQAVHQHDVILLPTYLYVRSWSNTIGLPDKHKSFVNSVIQAGKPVVLISLGNPYMIIGIDTPDVYLTAYGAEESSLQAVAQALFGKSTISGKLPISIPEHSQVGDGLLLEQVALRWGRPEEVGMDSAVLDDVDQYLRSAIQDGAFPGAALAVGRGDVVVKSAGYGHYTYEAETSVTPKSVFDLASLTKVVATTSAAMKLYEAGLLDLDGRVADYLPAFGQNGKENITIRQLLTHTAGMKPFYPFYRMDGISSKEDIIDFIMQDRVEYPPGTRAQYSDLNVITLALVIELLAGEEFGRYVTRTIFEPLGMHNTAFRPTHGRGDDASIVPTEVDNYFRNKLMQGEVHDEAAWMLGGTAGHAGLFSTAEDLARFAHMMAQGGMANGIRFFEEETVRLFTTRVDPDGNHTRALGWDTKSLSGYSSAGQLFGPRSFGHTGFTGTSMWIDPAEELFVILLTNRVHPTRENRKISQVRPRVADLVFKAIVGPPELWIKK